MPPEDTSAGTNHPRKRESLLKRGAVGFWFCAVGALGLLRAGLRISREGALPADAVGVIWLAGSMLVVLAGIVLVVRAARR